MDILEAQHRKIIIILVVVILAGGGYWMLKHFHPALFLGEPDLVVETEAVPPPSVPPTPTPKPEIAVHVAGAVKVPGVYYLATGARIHEAIEKAGGTTDRADVHSLNLAAIIRDGQQIDVPEIRQIPDVKQHAPVSNAAQEYTIPTSPDLSATPQPSTRRSAPLDGSYININTATSQELQTLRGIGPAMARRIIEYRQTSGGFSTVDDLTNVKGIGEKTLEKIRASIAAY
jgi:competence protein ComEA